MRILVPDAQSFHGGGETVTTKIIQAWTKSEKASVTWVLPPHRQKTFRRALGNNSDLEFESFQWASSHPRSWVLSFLRRVSSKLCSKWQTNCNLSKLRKIIEKHSCTHCFYFWTLGEPYPNLNIPTYCFIHDLAWKVIPESYSGKDLGKLDASVIEWVKKSNGTFTNSNQTRSEVLNLVPGLPNKIHTTLLAADTHRARIPSPENELPVDESLPFFLYPSAPNPQKNHLTLFQAALKLVERGLKFRLVLTGGNTQQLLGEKPMACQAPEQARSFFQERQSKLSGVIIALGMVSEDTLATLYQKCISVLMPSEYEGFGLAMAEAFSHGKPVIASNLPVFREQIECYHANDFVETFQTTDCQALIDLMEARLQQGEISVERGEELRRKADQWTWDDVAESCIRLMKKPDEPEAIAIH